MPAVKAHHRALPYRDVSSALCGIRACSASDSAKLCLEFLVLTATRSGEARGALWEELDLHAREWRIAGERMKTSADHVVPLTDRAMDVLRQARKLGKRDLVFPSPYRPAKPLSVNRRAILTLVPR